MNVINRILLKLNIDVRFLFEQKWGLRKPSDPFTIPKYIIKKYLPKNPTIIDCGAHVGDDSKELSKIFPRGKIISFEPIPNLFHQLVNNVRKRNNIQCYNIALSDNNGISKMYVSSGNSDSSSSLMEPTGHLKDHPDTFFNATIDVQTSTLDTWAEINNIPTVDFLWLDMQGFEYNMLKASNKILPSVRAIHTEVSIKETFKDCILYKEFSKWMKENGFVAAIEAIPEGTDMGNVLFVRE